MHSLSVSIAAPAGLRALNKLEKTRLQRQTLCEHPLGPTSLFLPVNRTDAILPFKTVNDLRFVKEMSLPYSRLEKAILVILTVPGGTHTPAAALEAFQCLYCTHRLSNPFQLNHKHSLQA